MRDSADESPDDEQRGATGRRRWLRRALAWGVTTLVVIFLLTRYSVGEVSGAIARGDWAHMIPFVAGAALWSLVFMATADWFVFSAALGKMPLLAVLRGKAGSSVLQAVNHSVGQGAYAVWIGRRTRAGLRPTLGVIGYVVMSDLTALFAVASVAVWLLEPGHTSQLPRVEMLRWVAPLVALGLVCSAFLAPRILPRLIRIKKVDLLEPWLRISPLHYLITVFLRAVSLLGIMFAMWGAMVAFGLDVPLGPSLAMLPVISLAGALPINVLGFGAVQLVWIAAFESWATGEEIIAFQLLLQLMLVIAFLLRGAPFLSSMLREIQRGKANEQRDQ